MKTATAMSTVSKKYAGLTSEDVKHRLQEWGYNEIEDTNTVSPVKLILRQLKKNFILYLLFFAAIASFFLKEPITGYVIFGVIILVILITFVQEFKAEKAIQELRKMINPMSVVIRDGKELQIPSREIVPDDIVILHTGERVPADSILLDENNLLINEAILTGESKEVKKTVPEKDTDAADENMLFAGSFIVNGRSVAKVLHTGMNTRFGKIVNLISEAEKELPLQTKINTIARYMVIAAVIISFATGSILISRIDTASLEAYSAVFIFLVALAVSAFPEGLPVVLMSSLAVGATRMARKNAIVNRMSIIETLGETTVICSDKTGTITRGEMSVRKIYTDATHIEVEGVGYSKDGKVKYSKDLKNDTGKSAAARLFQCALLCNDARIEVLEKDEEYKILGTPTEAALLVMAARAQLYVDDMEFNRVEEIPFNSKRKMMSVLCEVQKERIIFAKGAPEVLLKKCDYILVNGKKVKLTEKERDNLHEINHSLTKEAYRTLALAYKEAESSGKDYSEEHLVFLGLAAMEDSPREGVKEAIETCREAGIETKMITGDNKQTALAIADQIGLHGDILIGDELETMTDDELSKVVKNTVIFARVQPEHKVRIVKALKEIGEIVTMTGDGVNDAPALKDAHVGVAMGKNGTDVSRSVADLTLKDDHFVTIVEAIREGRTIFNNIRKFVSYLLSVNYAQIIVLFIGVLLGPTLGWQTPLLLALHILFINMITDDFPAITLGLNRSSKDVMREKPRRNPHILTKSMIYIMLITGGIMSVLTLLVYYVSFNIQGYAHPQAQTIAFLTLILMAIMNAFNFRSFRYLILNRSPFINPYLFIASMISLLATFIVIYVPWFRHIFETTFLDIKTWVIPVASTFLFVAVMDFLKDLNNKRKYFEIE